MSRTASPSGGGPYGLARVCRVWQTARASVYRHRAPARQAPPRRPGPIEAMPDAALLEAIRAVLAASPFHGEGHRKVWAGLRHGGVRTSKRRLLRLMDENDLLAPSRVGSPRGPRSHDGAIVPEAVDTMWGADPTTALTGKGQAAVFVALDHCSAECVGIHAAERADRFEALEPGLRRPRRCREPARACGAASAHSPRTPPAASPSGMTTARGTSAATSSASCASSASKAPPAFVRPPEGNGCAESFIRTLKEKLLWVRAFDTVEELRRALLGFRDLRRDMADRAARLQTAQRRPAGPASDRGTHRIGCNSVMLIIRGRYTPAPPRIWRHPSRMPVLSLYDSRVVLGALGQLSGPSDTSAPRTRDYGSQTGRGIGEPNPLGTAHIFHVDARSGRVH